MREILIRFDGVEKVYAAGAGSVRAVDHLDLGILRGEFLTLTGPSGSGKSTVLNLMAGLDSPTAGEITIDGQRLAAMSDDALTIFRRRKLGIIFQFFNLLPTLTAAENVALPLRADRRPRAEIAERVAAALGAVAMGHRARHRPAELSGGEMQRVAIARALVIDPIVLLADEPTGNLDSKMGQEILELVKGMSERTGVTVVLVTHDLRAAAYGDRMITLRDGRIIDEVTGPRHETVHHA
ncbi:MAG: ABC transporter ATP-binding protein [Myxococcales bacterium]|nr:ABC transporter ATP-binding protein [Myxococcales bacterium]